MDEILNDEEKLKNIKMQMEQEHKTKLEKPPATKTPNEKKLQEQKELMKAIFDM